MARNFTRAHPDARRQSLIDAAARVLAQAGPVGASVRAICGAAGVSPGLLRHYFSGIDALIAEAYRATGDRVAAALADAVAGAGADPRARLLAYVTASFRPPIADGDLLATWIAFWALARTRPDMAALHAEQYAGYRQGLEALLAEAGVAAETRGETAIALTALVDGLWLELCLAPEAFGAETAVAIAGDWVARVVGA